MITLKPPFRAQDMNGLFKRVTKGVYPPIGPSYSAELAQVVAKMLQVDPKNRPSCDQILALKVVVEKCKHYGI
jgi:serine/threonine protein kinase